VYSWFSIDDDPGRAQHRLMPAIDHWLESDLYPHPRRMAGVADPPPPGDRARLALTDTIAICGEREICAKAIQRLAAAGADTIVLIAPSDEIESQLDRFAYEVMPVLNARCER
jgi:alkanesulfonate monooxygenase SsuD/methylene tetrahydromethanopterin reductase-like flavin-dependent oxidoreductase (luciferase family)